MISIDMYMDKEQGKKVNYMGIIMCLLIAFQIITGCSKSDEGDPMEEDHPKLAVINESLKDYRFLRKHFDEPESYCSFLEELVALHYNSYLLVGSNSTLRRMERSGVSAWLRGREKSEAVLRQLCSEPKFVLEGNKWKVLFNVFKKDGSVDKWNVEGKYDPEKEHNQIDKITISILKQRGTFSWPLMG